MRSNVPAHPMPAMEEKDTENGNDSITMMDDIPFKHINYEIFVKLANKLDPDNLVMGNNWRLLADKLGYSMQHILVFESQQTSHGRNTLKVLLDYREKRGSTVNELYRALKEIERPDAVDILEAGISGIEKSYRDSLEKEARQQELMENDCGCSACDSNHSAYSGCPPPRGCHKHSMPVKNYNLPPGMYAPPPGLHSQLHMTHAPPKSYPRHQSIESSHYPAMRLPSFDHQSPEFKRQKSESMVVRGHDSHSQAFRDMEPMEHSPSLREDRVPPHVAIMRDIPRYNMSSVISGVSGAPSHLQNGDAMFRQPGTGAHRINDRPQLKLDIPSQMDLYNRQRSGDFMSPSPTPSTPSTPLDHLHKLANETTFQPNEGYQKMLDMKRREELLQGKAGPGGPYVNPEAFHQQSMAGVSRDCSYIDTQGNTAANMRMQANNGKAKCNGPPNTFPMRLKTNPQQLTKSVSVPNNTVFQATECRKAFRHIKVFVTYAADDRRHTQRVLNLCKCLEKNGFTCCVDIFHRKLPVDDRHDWYKLRFEEADFVLVVVSRKYCNDVDTCEMENDADDSDSQDDDVVGNDHRDDRPHRLHTKDIYRLMYREHVQNGQGSMRFVPLIFPDMSRDMIPPWMLDTQNHLFYEWPKQYKDLLWMLTKPENRVPEHLVPTGSRCHSESEAEKASSDASELSVESE